VFVCLCVFVFVCVCVCVCVCVLVFFQDKTTTIATTDHMFFDRATGWVRSQEAQRLWLLICMLTQLLAGASWQPDTG
jgi:hypothetical protein